MDEPGDAEQEAEVADRFTRNAFMLAKIAEGRVYQNPISR